MRRRRSQRHLIREAALPAITAHGAVCRIAPAPPANVDAPSPQQLERMIFGSLPRNVSRRVGPRRAPECRTCSIASLHLFLCDRWHGHMAIAFTIGSMGLRGLQHSLAPAGDCGRAGAARADVCRAHAGDSHPPRRCEPTANATGAGPGGLAGQRRARRERRVS